MNEQDQINIVLEESQYWSEVGKIVGQPSEIVHAATTEEMKQD